MYNMRMGRNALPGLHLAETYEYSLGLMSMWTREVEWMYFRPRVTWSSRSLSSSSVR